MKKGGFWDTYKIIIGFLLLLGLFLLAYVEKSLQKYEASQPEKVIEAYIDEIIEASKTGTLGRALNFNRLSETEISSYTEKLKNAEKWDYKVLNGSYSETDQTYGIYADNELVAKIDISCDSSEVMMVILTVNDWNILEAYPVVVTPVPTRVTDEADGKATGTPFVTPSAMPTGEPEEIIVNKYRYTFSLPSEYTVSFNGELLEGAEDAGMTKYVFDTEETEPVFTVSDSYGWTEDYAFGETLTYYDIVVKIPDNFELILSDVDVSRYFVGSEENPKYEFCNAYADMPALVTYDFPKALTHLAFEIKDNLGNNIEYMYDGDTIVLTEQTVIDEIPGDIIDPSELLKTAEMWSLFLTNDLYKYDFTLQKYDRNAVQPEDKGLSVMRSVLVKNSYLDTEATRYAKGVDITFISAHILPDLPFAEEYIGNYVKYSDDLFACDISFEKIILRTNGQEFTLNGDRDKLNSTCYFLRNKEYDGSETMAKWLLIGLTDKLGEVSQTTDEE